VKLNFDSYRGIQLLVHKYLFMQAAAIKAFEVKYKQKSGVNFADRATAGPVSGK
jgi:hypothetical protein